MTWLALCRYPLDSQGQEAHGQSMKTRLVFFQTVVFWDCRESTGSSLNIKLFLSQALVVLVHDMGPNWELISDAINSTLQFKVNVFYKIFLRI